MNIEKGFPEDRQNLFELYPVHALIGSDMCSLRASFPGYSGGGTGKELPEELASRLECVGIAELVVTDKNGTFPKR